MNEVTKREPTLSEKIPTHIVGILGSSIILTSFIISALFYKDSHGNPYSILNFFVSELGNVGVSQLAWIFNVGLIIGGSLLAIFMFGLMGVIKTKLARISCILGVLSAIAAALVGVFPMNNLIPHALVAMLFFYGGMITVALFAIVIYKDPEHNFPKRFAFYGVVIFIFFFIFHFVPLDNISMDFEEVFNLEGGVLNLDLYRPEIWYMALMEWLVILGVVLWMLLIAVNLTMKKINQNNMK